MACAASTIRSGPVSVGDRYVTYDRASDDPDINDVLYIGYFGSGAWATTAGGGAYNFYFTHNPGTAFEANMTNYWATLSFTPTDAGYIPYNPPISRQLYAYRAWGFYAGVTGQGVINEPIQGPSVSGHLANIQAILAPETPYGPDLKNAAVFTPLAGSMLTANQYFTGGSSPISLSCQKSFIMLATDGNPTSDFWGNMYPLDQQVNSYNAVNGSWTFSRAANDVFGQISALRTVTVGGFAHDIQTYVVGMGDTVANPSSVAAMNQFANLGGTGSGVPRAGQHVARRRVSGNRGRHRIQDRGRVIGVPQHGFLGHGHQPLSSALQQRRLVRATDLLRDQCRWLDRRAAMGLGTGDQWPELGYGPHDPDLQAVGGAGFPRHRLSLARELPGDTVGDGNGLGAGRPAECTGRNLGRRIEQRGVVERWRVRLGVDLLQLRIRARRRDQR